MVKECCWSTLPQAIAIRKIYPSNSCRYFVIFVLCTVSSRTKVTGAPLDQTMSTRASDRSGRAPVPVVGDSNASTSMGSAVMRFYRLRRGKMPLSSNRTIAMINPITT